MDETRVFNPPTQSIPITVVRTMPAATGATELKMLQRRLAGYTTSMRKYRATIYLEILMEDVEGVVQVNWSDDPSSPTGGYYNVSVTGSYNNQEVVVGASPRVEFAVALVREVFVINRMTVDTDPLPIEMQAFEAALASLDEYKSPVDVLAEKLEAALEEPELEPDRDDFLDEE